MLWRLQLSSHLDRDLCILSSVVAPISEPVFEDQGGDFFDDVDPRAAALQQPSILEESALVPADREPELEDQDAGEEVAAASVAADRSAVVVESSEVPKNLMLFVRKSNLCFNYSKINSTFKI